MKTRIVVILIALLTMCGCDAPDCCDFWEYSAPIPVGTSVQDMMSIESTLRTNGYVRIRFVTHYGWSDEPVGITVYATRKEGGAK